MMETDLWGDGRLLLCRDSAEKTVSRTIDLDDEEWSDTCEESKPSWSVDDDFNDQMVLVNPLVVESMVNIDGSYTIEQISCQNSFDSDVCEEMNPPCDDDFSLIDFIFDDNRPLCDGQFQDLIENPELVQTAEGECLEYSAAISLDDVLVRVTHEDTVPLDSNQATPADNASPESALPDTERPKYDFAILYSNQFFYTGTVLFLGGGVRRTPRLYRRPRRCPTPRSTAACATSTM